MSVSYMTHPLIRHKITLLRKEDTSTNEFRKLVEEIAMLMGYEAGWKTTNCGSAAAALLPLRRKKAALFTDWCGSSHRSVNSLWTAMKGIPATTRKKP